MSRARTMRADAFRLARNAATVAAQQVPPIQVSKHCSIEQLHFGCCFTAIRDLHTFHKASQGKTTLSLVIVTESLSTAPNPGLIDTARSWRLSASVLACRSAQAQTACLPCLCRLPMRRQIKRQQKAAPRRQTDDSCRW